MTTRLSPFSANSAAPLYQQVGDRITSLIESGTLSSGERLPSVRKLSREWAVSITTVLEAYRLLENRGLIEVRPQSGHYVRPQMRPTPVEPEFNRSRIQPTAVSLGELSVMTQHDAQDPSLLHLGAAVPNPAMLPSERLNRALSAVARRSATRATAYEFAPGAKSYRVEVARRAVAAGCALSPDEIIATTGCTGSIFLCLNLLCRPGDAVAVETPTYYGQLRVLEGLGLQAIEIPTHHQTGMSLDTLEYALREHTIKAVIVTANFHNPTGSLMPDANKERLVSMLAEREIPLIEDDVYGDITYEEERPRVCKAYDNAGLVLLCSSFSKTLAPGYRAGYLAGGRFHHDLVKMQITVNLTTPTLPQLAVAEFLANGGYEHHLRRIRRMMIHQMTWLRQAVSHYFPEGTRITDPRGGITLWVTLPEEVDCLALYDRAIRHRISISPGFMFSAKRLYRNCIRLNAAFATEDTEEQIATLGRIAGELRREGDTTE